MKSGTITSIGIELESSSDLRLDTALIGFFQFFIYLSLRLFQVVPPSSTGLVISFVILLGSMAMLLTLRRSQVLGTYAIDWRDSRDSSGDLVVSYTNPKGKRRADLVVAKVETHPDQPLFVPGRSRYKPVIPVPGTAASLVITFKNMKRIGLGLGFGSLEAMNKVYEQLR
jgi:hypothetical protein